MNIISLRGNGAGRCLPLHDETYILYTVYFYTSAKLGGRSCKSLPMCRPHTRPIACVCAWVCVGLAVKKITPTLPASYTAHLRGKSIELVNNKKGAVVQIYCVRQYTEELLLVVTPKDSIRFSCLSARSHQSWLSKIKCCVTQEAPHISLLR